MKLLWFALTLLAFRNFAMAQSEAMGACPIISPGAADAVVASPQNYKVMYETDDIRVIEVTVAPHTKEITHIHARPAVMYLDQPIANEMYLDGSARVSALASDSKFKPIAVWIAPEGLHAIENTGDTQFHAIRVEFKHPDCALPGVATVSDAGSQDGVKVWPEGHRVLFENKNVRVLDVINAPHSKEPFHTHVWPAFFYVVHAVPMKYSTQDGAAPVMLGVPPTKIIPLAPNPMHSVENLGEEDAHFIRFELKLASVPKSLH